EGAAGQRLGPCVVAEQQRGLGALLQQGRVVGHDLQRLVERAGGFGVVPLRFQARGLLAQVLDLGVAQRLDRELALAVARGGADGGDLLLRRGGGQRTRRRRWLRRRAGGQHDRESGERAVADGGTPGGGKHGNIHQRCSCGGGVGACCGTSRAGSRGLESSPNQLRQPPPCSSSGSGCWYTQGS